MSMLPGNLTLTRLIERGDRVNVHIRIHQPTPGVKILGVDSLSSVEQVWYLRMYVVHLRVASLRM